jgi:hypothetical protein
LTSITIPKGVTDIGAFAFAGCSDLTTVTIHEGLMTIGAYAFSRCNCLLSITIPSTVDSIGIKAFSDCKKLTIKDNRRFANSLSRNIYNYNTTPLNKYRSRVIRR